MISHHYDDDYKHRSRKSKWKTLQHRFFRVGWRAINFVPLKKCGHKLDVGSHPPNINVIRWGWKARQHRRVRVGGRAKTLVLLREYGRACWHVRVCRKAINIVLARKGGRRRRVMVSGRPVNIVMWGCVEGSWTLSCQGGCWCVGWLSTSFMRTGWMYECKNHFVILVKIIDHFGEKSLHTYLIASSLVIVRPEIIVLTIWFIDKVRCDLLVPVNAEVKGFITLNQ